MALLAPKKIVEQTKIKLEIDKELFDKINNYCAWIGISDLNDFFTQSAQFILDTDKDWKSYLKSIDK
ncbi:hypothetical protein Lsan_0430 [Legionella santicrucis]|uniref:Uncharacterized protein n=1 Tax=Legionella santicrucis TaxID=45074 RepID=A0A0W0ZBE2_9GAMM|nr:hypothetical protein [Legionella santicrucis]KTD66485.1 hypothetical protein Lsan_0430 [Legionella santicrucis]